MARVKSWQCLEQKSKCLMFEVFALSTANTKSWGATYIRGISYVRDLTMLTKTSPLDAHEGNVWDDVYCELKVVLEVMLTLYLCNRSVVCNIRHLRE